MSQVSLPLRIALVSVLALSAVWMVILRPKVQEAPAEPPIPATQPATGATAPGAAGLGRATDKAKAAVATANAAGAGTSDQAAAATARPAPAKTTAAAATRAPEEALEGVAPGDPSAPLLRALAADKVVVVLFANTRSSDDREVRRALRGVATHGGAVVKRVVDVKRVGRYEAITRGVKIDQSPTTLVIGSDRVARAVAGLTTTAELQQLADDARATAEQQRK